MRMRKSSLTLLAAGWMLTTGCGKLTTFPITEKADTTVQGGGIAAMLLSSIPFSGFTNMDLTQNDTLKNQGVKKNQISSVKLTKATLTVTSPSGQTLDFISSLKFVAQTSGVADAEVAHGTDFSGASTDLTPDGAELKPYVTADSMTISTDASGQLPPNDTTIHAELSFDVQVDLVGAVTGK